MATNDNGTLTIEALRGLVQGALELEHATIPPYLCALYSMVPGTNQESHEIVASVFIEEMLHLVQAANILNAIGGAPVVDDPSFIARYPTTLPHSNGEFIVSLARFSPATIETFLRIERPEDEGSRSEAEGFETIGQFYCAIEDGLVELCATMGEAFVFCGDPARQVTPEILDYHGDRRLVVVHDLASVLDAIDEIEEQGEGLKHAEVWDGDRDMFHPEREEVAHYFRFSEIIQGRSYRRGDTPQSGPSGPSFSVDWSAVYPMRDNPRCSDLPEASPVRRKMEEFNALYSDLLRLLHRAFNGEPAQVSAAISAMMEVRDRARELMQLPSGDGVTNAGPSFEYVAAVAEPDVRSSGVTINVRANGPYVVTGGLPLVRKSTVYSEFAEPLTWRKDSTLSNEGSYRLCRCGRSGRKPFCDGTHARIGFDGTESASVEASSSRRERLEGTRISLTDDHSLCVHAGFCGNRAEDVWNLVERTDDSQVRFQLMHMVEQCPSGRLIYELDGVALEPDLTTEVSVTKDGPYWVTGDVTVTMSDGQTLETRNRVTLCRCGKSSNKPLCDGTHKETGFKDG